MTLGAMAIAIGIVIDDAVVITENIVRHAASAARSRPIAIREAVQELIWPVTTSTITTVVVFLPLGLLTGVEGQFFKALSITLTIAVLVSLVVALTIIPLLSEQFLDAERRRARRRRRGRSGKRRARARRPRASIRSPTGTSARSARALRHARWMIVVAVRARRRRRTSCSAASPTGFLPEIDEGAFVLDYFSPGGTALAETDRQVHIVEQILLATPEITGISRRTGAELGLFATEQNRGDIDVRLKPEGERDRSIAEVIDEVRDEGRRRPCRACASSSCRSSRDVINDLAGAARPVEIKLFGADLDALEAYAKKLEPKLSKVDGIEDFFNGVSEPSAELTMTINHGRGESRRPDAASRSRDAVSGALLGVPAGEVRLEDRSVGVRVRAPDSVRFDPLQLGALPIVSPATQDDGAARRAGDASSRPRRARQLLRENQQQMITMTADRRRPRRSAR